jgi:hypothetical protein
MGPIPDGTVVERSLMLVIAFWAMECFVAECEVLRSYLDEGPWRTQP